MFSHRFVVRGLLAVVPMAVLAWIIWQDLAPGGELTIINDFHRRYSNISSFYPLGRLSVPVADGDGWEQKINIEPVYIDVRLPRRLNEARLRLVYRSKGVEDLRVGLRIGALSDWRFDFRRLADLDRDEFPGWRVGTATFDLANATVENGRIRFIVSAPSLKNGDKLLVVRRVEATLSGKPLALNDISDVLARRFWRVMEYVK